MSAAYIVVTAPAGFDGSPVRRNHYCKTKREAQELRLRIKRWKAEKKSPTDTLTFDDNDKRWLGYLRAHVGNLELLPQIVAHWERTAKPITQSLTVGELCSAYVTYREGLGLHKGTLADDRYGARKLRLILGDHKVQEIGSAELRSFLNNAKSETTQRKFYKIGSLIFAYGKEQRALMINPFDEITRPKVRYAVPGILAPIEFEALLLTAEKEVPDILPFLVLAGFAGLRRDEILKEYARDEVLQWEDIDWEKKLITVREAVAKRTTRKMGDRRFVPMEPALIHWLAPYRKNCGPVLEMVDSAFRRRTKKLRELTGVNPPDNALRHSYASYWLARSQKEGLGRLALQMGNSEAVCRRHYLESLTPGEGEAWFGLRRSRAALRVISAKAA